MDKNLIQKNDTINQIKNISQKKKQNLKSKDEKSKS